VHVSVMGFDGFSYHVIVHPGTSEQPTNTSRRLSSLKSNSLNFRFSFGIVKIGWTVQSSVIGLSGISYQLPAATMSESPSLSMSPISIPSPLRSEKISRDVHVSELSCSHNNN